MKDEDSFSILRELLSNPMRDYQENENLYALLKQTYQEKEREYSELWLPYCQQHHEAFNQRKTCYSIKELKFYAAIVPFVQFDLSFELDYDVSISELNELMASEVITQVHTLSFERYDFGESGIKVITESPNACHIAGLDLNECVLTDEDIMAIAYSTYIKNLEYLCIANCYVTSEVFKHIANSESCKELQTFAFIHNGTLIDDTDLNALINSDSANKLEELDLSWNELSHSSIQILTHSEQLTNLRKLELGSNYLDDIEAEMIANSEYLTQLRELDLCENKIGDKGCIQLANSPSLSHLKKLDLSSNLIGKKGYLALVCSITLTEGIRMKYMNKVEKQDLIHTANEYGVRGKFDEKTKEEIVQLIWRQRAEKAEPRER